MGLRSLFSRRREEAPFAGVLSGWTACSDVGGLYYRGLLEHDELGRFEDGVMMTTGYVVGEPDAGGVLTATDACYRLGAPGQEKANGRFSATPRNAAPQVRRVEAREPERRSFIPEESFREPSDEESLLHFRTSTHFELLFRSAMSASSISVKDSPRILVIGAGTGSNAVGPCLRLFRGAQIIAADPSEEALATLRGHLRNAGAEDRVITIQAKPDDPPPEEAAFDLVAGVSVLHRMLDPDRGLANAAHALKGGGHAIFMEPFEGYGLIRLAFQRIGREAELRAEPLPVPVWNALQAVRSDIAARTAPDTSSPAFAEMNQKWLFSRESIAAAARMLGFAESRFISHNDHGSFYRDLGLMMLSSHCNDAAVELPEWALAILDEYDQALPPSVKRLLMVEGSIVLTRGPDLC